MDDWILTDEGWALGERVIPISPVPDYFKEKWDLRTQKILNSPDCPRKDDGTPDWSVIEFRVAQQCFYGYRYKPEEKQAEVQGWIARIIADQAQSRNKNKPLRYAGRTARKAVGQIIEEIDYIDSPLDLLFRPPMSNKKRTERWASTWER